MGASLDYGNEGEILACKPGLDGPQYGVELCDGGLFRHKSLRAIALFKRFQLSASANHPWVVSIYANKGKNFALAVLSYRCITWSLED